MKKSRNQTIVARDKKIQFLSSLFYIQTVNFFFLFDVVFLIPKQDKRWIYFQEGFCPFYVVVVFFSRRRFIPPWFSQNKKKGKTKNVPKLKQSHSVIWRKKLENIFFGNNNIRLLSFILWIFFWIFCFLFWGGIYEYDLEHFTCTRLNFVIQKFWLIFG